MEECPFADFASRVSLMNALRLCGRPRLTNGVRDLFYSRPPDPSKFGPTSPASELSKLLETACSRSSPDLTMVPMRPSHASDLVGASWAGGSTGMWSAGSVLISTSACAI